MSEARISSFRGEPFPPGLPGPGFEFAIVETVAATEFLDLRETAIHPERYTRGRAFGGDGQLEWMKRGSGFHLVYVSDSGKCLPGAQECCAVEVLPNEEPGRIFLWGKFDAGRKAFLEGRIPAALRYPARFPAVAAEERLAVCVRHYRFEWKGEWKRIYRCVDVVPESAACGGSR